MINDTYVLVTHDFTAPAALACGPDVREEDIGATLARLYDHVSQLPLRLQ
jgi:hypothetical protein